MVAVNNDFTHQVILKNMRDSLYLGVLCGLNYGCQVQHLHAPIACMPSR